MFRFWFFKCARLNRYLVLILSLALPACSGGDGGIGGSSIGLSWVAPSEREDGSSLSLSEITGYRLYYGVESGVYRNKMDVKDGSAVYAKVLGVPSGTYYVAVTAIDTEGRESSYSSEIIIVR